MLMLSALAGCPYSCSSCYYCCRLAEVGTAIMLALVQVPADGCKEIWEVAIVEARLISRDGC